MADDTPPAVLYPAAAEAYRQHVQDLEAALNDPGLRGEAAGVRRGLMARIVLTPDALAEDGLRAELHGVVAEMLSLPAMTPASDDVARQKPAGTGVSGGPEMSQLSVVAGTRNQLGLLLTG